MDVEIRNATPEDLPAINDLYNYYVRHTTATFAEQPVSSDERARWWAAHAERYPVLVAREGPDIIGWASLSPYSGRCGYRNTVENSIYLRPEVCGKGLGKRLLAELLARARTAGYRSVIAAICHESTPSLRLHAAAGYREVGRLSEVGWKFERWLDVVFIQLALRDGE